MKVPPRTIVPTLAALALTAAGVGTMIALDDPDTLKPAPQATSPACPADTL
ncbi:hypothetical protein [Streptomyces sp. BA2]|uniref:hypothetical protein n=1 Tax=Streptomyces sp. BA2 TaxID=436595 RepID=UPI001321C65C|nr:hypothetical protein [Streptomyces sp. BA2]MWA16064.1 hypothetical protein [Streptomyces sp. BA2]